MLLSCAGYLEIICGLRVCRGAGWLDSAAGGAEEPYRRRLTIAFSFDSEHARIDRSHVYVPLPSPSGSCLHGWCLHLVRASAPLFPDKSLLACACSLFLFTDFPLRACSV